MFFEYVRVTMFPHMPSRFQSIFALESIDLFQQWPELTRGKYTIYEIEFDSPHVCLDSCFLRGGLHFSKQNSYQGFAAGFMFDYSQKYWAGIMTENPRIELLIAPPVNVIREVTKVSNEK